MLSSAATARSEQVVKITEGYVPHDRNCSDRQIKTAKQSRREVGDRQAGLQNEPNFSREALKTAKHYRWYCTLLRLPVGYM
jgi:hypothetical protein